MCVVRATPSVCKCMVLGESCRATTQLSGCRMAMWAYDLWGTVKTYRFRILAICALRSSHVCAHRRTAAQGTAVRLRGRGVGHTLRTAVCAYCGSRFGSPPPAPLSSRHCNKMAGPNKCVAKYDAATIANTTAAITSTPSTTRARRAIDGRALISCAAGRRRIIASERLEWCLPLGTNAAVTWARSTITLMALPIHLHARRRTATGEHPLRERCAPRGNCWPRSALPTGHVAGRSHSVACRGRSSTPAAALRCSPRPSTP